MVHRVIESRLLERGRETDKLIEISRKAKPNLTMDIGEHQHDKSRCKATWHLYWETSNKIKVFVAHVTSLSRVLQHETKRSLISVLSHHIKTESNNSKNWRQQQLKTYYLPFDASYGWCLKINCVDVIWINWITLLLLAIVLYRSFLVCTIFTLLDKR